MTVEIQKESNPNLKINKNLLIFAVETVLNEHNKPEMNITLRLTGDSEVRQLNQSFRGIARTSDVLSFNQDFIDPETNQLYLGDIVISLDRAIQQTLDNDHSLDEECAFLAIHGTLHLLGYDHYKPDEMEEMWQLQDELFEKVITTYSEVSK